MIPHVIGAVEQTTRGIRNDAAIGERLGPSVAKDQVTKAITTILDVYVKNRLDDESFLSMVNRVGITPFKEQVYADN